jgi:putative endonuclease
MTNTKKELGAQGEAIAMAFLKRNRYKILCTNYRCVFGEIDIVAEHKKTLCFIEVKTRRTAAYGAPQEAVSARKQQTMGRVALHFLQRFHLEDRAARFDVMAIRLAPGGYSLDVITDAFELPR